MKRRNFLKLVAAAVVCPKGLLKAEPTTKAYAAYRAAGGQLTHREYKKLIEKFRKAYKNTKFKKPVYSYGITYYFRNKRNA